MNHLVEEPHYNDIGCDNACYKVDGVEFSLRDIEDLLRGKVAEDDTRSHLDVITNDPRVLLAIRPGYWSSEFPYDAKIQKELSAALQVAGESFVTNTFQYNKKHNQVVVPEVMKWYETEFGKGKELLERAQSFVNNKAWLKTWKKTLASNPTIIYQPYRRSYLRFLPNTL